MPGGLGYGLLYEMAKNGCGFGAEQNGPTEVVHVTKERDVTDYDAVGDAFRRGQDLDRRQEATYDELTAMMDAANELFSRVELVRRALVAQATGKNVLAEMVAMVVEHVNEKFGGGVRSLSKDEVWGLIREKPRQGFHAFVVDAMEREYGREAIEDMDNIRWGRAYSECMRADGLQDAKADAPSL